MPNVVRYATHLIQNAAKRFEHILHIPTRPGGLEFGGLESRHVLKVLRKD